MTRKQAWMRIRQEFVVYPENYNPLERFEFILSLNKDGVCTAINLLYSEGEISLEVYRAMKGDLLEYSSIHVIKTLYFFPVNSEGAKQRVAMMDEILSWYPNED